MMTELRCSDVDKAAGGIVQSTLQQSVSAIVNFCQNIVHIKLKQSNSRGHT